MTKPSIRIHDIETDKVVDREMTNAEFAQYQLDQEAKIQRDAEQTAQITAKAELLERLGITAEEAALLLA
jgi:hypothetical protein